MLKTLLCGWLGICYPIAGPAYVLDGDTISVQNIHVRLNGLDAEELGSIRGDLARSAMQRIVKGQTVTCHLNGEKSYNRMVGSCFVQDLDIAGEMVRQGYALDCLRYSNGRYRHLEPPHIRTMLRQQPYC